MVVYYYYYYCVCMLLLLPQQKLLKRVLLLKLVLIIKHTESLYLPYNYTGDCFFFLVLKLKNTYNTTWCGYFSITIFYTFPMAKILTRHKTRISILLDDNH